MSTYLGETPICGGIEGNQLNNPFSLLDYKFSEYEITNASWLRSNGQFNSGVVYSSVYNLLQGIYNGTTTKAGVSVKLSTEPYTDTDFVINTADTTFRLPLLNGDRVLVKKYVNGANWYNLYSDGWLEQGGTVQASYTGQTITLNMLKSFSNADWTIVTTVSSSVMPPCLEVVVGQGKTNNSTGVIIAAYDKNNQTNGFYWKACGYAEVPTQSDYTELNGLYYYVGETIQDANVINASGVLTRVAELSDSYISGLGMPSSRYINLTLGASGSVYTAPANGWFAGWSTPASANNTGYVSFMVGEVGNGYAQEIIPAAGYQQPLLLSVKKGTGVKIIYDKSDLAMLRFYYAEGEN